MGDSGAYDDCTAALSDWLDILSEGAMDNVHLNFQSDISAAGNS